MLHIRQVMHVQSNSSSAPCSCREGTYKGHRGDVLQLLCLGDVLLSLGSDSKLILWNVGEYKPQVCGKGAPSVWCQPYGFGLMQHCRAASHGQQCCTR